jgi:hypothetical protein
MIRLPSLGLVLTKGMVVYVDKDKAEASQELQNAQRAKGVDLKYVERCVARVGEATLSSVRAYPVPIVDAPVTVAPTGSGHSEHATNMPVNTPSLDLRGVQYQMQKVRDKVGDLCSKSEMEAIVEKHIGVLGEKLGQQIADAVSNIKVAPVVVERSAEVKSVEKKEEMPLFIPDNLVKSDMKGDVSVKQDQVESGGVGDAASALREMKKKGK